MTKEQMESAYGPKALVNMYLTTNEGKLANGEPRTVESFARNRRLPVPNADWETDEEFLMAVRLYIGFQWQLSGL